MTHYLAFIRHGSYQQQAHCPSAFQPYPLTSEGREQAKKCAASLLDMASQLSVAIAPQLHCSVLLRAWETASIIGAELHRSLGHPPSLLSSEQLNERCVGSLANLTVQQIEQVLKDDPRFDSPPSGWKSNSDYRLPVPGAESLMDSGERVANYCRQLVASDSHAESLQLVVGHGASMRHAAYLLGILSRSDISKLSMYHATPVVLKYDGKIWKHVAGDWKVRAKHSALID
tara:strand:- start:670 stop:1359 length:690 start_codon:yes stop_codon:yes gene_type:complete